MLVRQRVAREIMYLRAAARGAASLAGAAEHVLTEQHVVDHLLLDAEKLLRRLRAAI